MNAKIRSHSYCQCSVVDRIVNMHQYTCPKNVLRKQWDVRIQLGGGAEIPQKSNLLLFSLFLARFIFFPSRENSRTCTAYKMELKVVLENGTGVVTHWTNMYILHWEILKTHAELLEILIPCSNSFLEALFCFYLDLGGAQCRLGWSSCILKASLLTLQFCESCLYYSEVLSLWIPGTFFQQWDSCYSQNRWTSDQANQEVTVARMLPVHTANGGSLKGKRRSFNLIAWYCIKWAVF